MYYVILDWYCVTNTFVYGRMFVIHTYEQCPFVISYLIFNEFVATYPAFVQI